MKLKLSKMAKNVQKCADLGWECIPLAIDTYGGWGEKAQETFGCATRRLAVGSTTMQRSPSEAAAGHVSLTLVSETKLRSEGESSGYPRKS